MGRKAADAKPFTVEQDKFVRMEANGYTTEEIIRELFGVEKKDDYNKFHTLECKLSRWRYLPQYMEIWKDEVAQVSIKLMNKGLKKFLAQMDNEEAWLANKAANDAVNFAKSRIFAEEDRAITVKVEGLPDIGSPDSED